MPSTLIHAFNGLKINKAAVDAVADKVDANQIQLLEQQRADAAAAAEPEPAAFDVGEAECEPESTVGAEVALQLHNIMATLPAFQQLLVREQLEQKPSRLYARLCAYVADAAADASDAAAANDGATPAVVPFGPVLTHPTFKDALQHHLLRLLEERWESVFAASCSLSEGRRISRAERAAKRLDTTSLVYGEVSIRLLGGLLWGPLCASVPQVGATFVDLGSGTSRGVLAAAAVFPFARLIGIEILEGLHAAAVDVVAHYDRAVRPTYTASGDPRLTQKIELACGSFLELDWAADADVVFANSTCFGEELMAKIAVQGQALRDGAVFITTTDHLDSPYFRLVYSESHVMPQGTATVNVHIKRTPSQEEIAAALVRQQAERAKDHKNRRHTHL